MSVDTPIKRSSELNTSVGNVDAHIMQQVRLRIYVSTGGERHRPIAGGKAHPNGCIELTEEEEPVPREVLKQLLRYLEETQVNVGTQYYSVGDNNYKIDYTAQW